MRITFQMWLGHLFCCFLACSAGEIHRSNSYLDKLLKNKGTLMKAGFFNVSDLEVTVDADGYANPEFRATFTKGKLSNTGSFQRSGDCDGPVRLVGSSYIKCSVLLRKFEVSYSKGQHFSRTNAARRTTSARAHILDSLAEVEFHHFKENMTEQVRVTVDEVKVHLDDLEPKIHHIPQKDMFKSTVIFMMNETLSTVIPEILADRLILAMDSVDFPHPR